MLIEGLDAIIPFDGNGSWGSPSLSEAERRQWAPYNILRARLKGIVHMSFYDHARGWLDAELARERIAITDKLHSRLAELLREPKATRRSVKQGFVTALRELREVRQSKPRPLSD